jgi:hypothetical protein
MGGYLRADNKKEGHTMVDESRTATPGTGNATQVEIWYCAGCKAVQHMGFGETLISFDRRRFSEFAAMVAEIHYDSFAAPGAYDILDLAREIDVESPSRRLGN